MSFFKQVEGEAAVLVENGVYKQVDLYTRDGYLNGILDRRTAAEIVEET